MPKALPKDYLAPEDWLKAGFRALATRGPSGLQINPIAKSLKATKGSFYWHFKDFGAYKSAMLALWRTKVVDEIRTQVEAVPQGGAQLAVLETLASAGPEREFGGPKIDTAMRAWALADPEVGVALSAIDADRLVMLQEILSNVGLDDPNLAALVYGCYLGVDDLVARGAVQGPDALTKLVEVLAAMAHTKNR